MNSVRCDNYCNIPFISDIQKDDFFTHISVRDLITVCHRDKDSIIKCRTIGVLESVDGRFYIKDINLIGKENSPSILVSMAYIKTQLPSAVIPYTVQLFGTIQWRGKPVIFASIVQVLKTATALSMIDAVTTITTNHLANKTSTCEIPDTQPNV